LRQAQRKAAPSTATLRNRLLALLSAGVLLAFFLPWIDGAQRLSGLELVALARGRQAEQAETAFIVAFAAVPFLALLTLAASLIRQGVRFFGGLCGLLAMAVLAILWLARRAPEAGEPQLGYGAYASGLFGLLMLLAALGVLRLPAARPALGERR
jgi:hypothetical protein